jgi:hypothetical protein
MYKYITWQRSQAKTSTTLHTIRQAYAYTAGTSTIACILYCNGGKGRECKLESFYLKEKKETEDERINKIKRQNYTWKKNFPKE